MTFSDEPAAGYDTPALVRAAGPPAVAAWERFALDEHLSPRSRYLYQLVARKFLDRLEAERIELIHVTPHDVDRYLDTDRFHPRTRSSYRQILGRFFDALVVHATIAGNPARCRNIITPFEDQFAGFTPEERQATVDAAAVALVMHEVYRFTGGAGGHEAHLERCEEALRVGEQYGVTPLPQLKSSEPDPG